MAKVSIHPAAKVVPEMTDVEYSELVASIKASGLLVAIELLDGKVIDGRHRLKACRELDIDPHFAEITLNGMTPGEYVWATNGIRRHLTASQKATVAVELLPGLKHKHPQGKHHPEKIPGEDNRERAAAIVGVNPHYVSDAEKIKDESPELFDEIKSGKTTISKAKKKLKDDAKAKEDKAAAAKAKKAIKASDENGVYHGNSFELASTIPDDSVALIFTDPPYDRESLPLFNDLAELAGRVLINEGSLITYCGQYVLPTVIDSLLSDERMRFFWINCCLHTGKTAQMTNFGIKVKWKPMLWFVKGQFRRDRTTWVDDLVVSKQEKDAHPWQQSVIEAGYYIERLTKKGEMVVDPFCGGGTTALAAKNLKRHWWTADVVAKHVSTARKRLNDENI